MKRISLLIGGLLLLASPMTYAADGIFNILTSTNPEALSQFISSHSLISYLSVFFLLGILLAFTPCVLPMVPILSGIIIKEDKEKSLSLSVSYVLGMAITYAVAGMGAAMLGKSLQVAMQHPAFLVGFSLLFVAFALDLLGVIQLRLPQGANVSVNTNGSYGKTFFMGVISTLIVSPCVTAPLLGVLGFIAQSQQVLLGGLILFVLALGMGLPLLLVGAGQGRFLPRSGAWMTSIKALFGFMMLGMAVYLLSRLLPDTISLGLYALLFASMAVYLLLHSQQKRVLTFIASLPLFALSINVAVSAVKAYSVTPTHVALFHPVNKLADIDAILAQKAAEKQPVYLEFYASWCSDCTEMDKNVFSQIDIQQAMKSYYNVRVDITDDTPAIKAIKKRFGVYGTPFMTFYNENGELQKNRIAAGYIPHDKMLSLLLG